MTLLAGLSSARDMSGEAAYGLGNGNKGNVLRAWAEVCLRWRVVVRRAVDRKVRRGGMSSRGRECYYLRTALGLTVLREAESESGMSRMPAQTRYGMAE